jgi:hypothetical protein
LIKFTIKTFCKITNNAFKAIVCTLLLVTSITTKAQSVTTNIGFLLKAQLQLGNQNKSVKIGAYGLGTAQYKNFALESGVALYSGYLFKRHTIKTKGFNFGYDAFILGGIGTNKNLLGSSFFEDGALVATIENNQRFYGIGLGFEKEFLPGKLKTFNQRLGKFLMRFSTNNGSVNLQFKNDFRGGNIFNGEGTDFGKTGSFTIGYSKILNPLEIYQVGIALELFTPAPDYSKTPNNILNSADGSRNVWYTKPPFKNVFYANLYAFGSYQNNYLTSNIKAGVNSQKIGAFVQNTLHDSFGLNPRFPWNVSAKDKIFVEFTNSFNNNVFNE